MIPVTTFARRQVAVFGLGASGLATAHALLAGGATVAAWDDGDASRDAAARAGIPIVDLNTAEWSQFAALVLSPGVPLTHPMPHWTVLEARAAAVDVIGDIELFCRERRKVCPDSPFIAITGTNGKSTTTALVAHILKAAGRDVQMGGNIGRAILTLDPPALDRFHVIEMSSFQIDLTPSLDPSIGVLLNITPDHLDRHGPADDPALAMRNYSAIKARLVEGAMSTVIGMEDGFPHAGDLCEPIFHALEHSSRLDRAFIRGKPGFSEMIYFEAGCLRRLHGLPNHSGYEEVLTDLNKAKALRGAHNAENAAAAFLVCELLGLPHDEIGTAIKSYPGLPHRMEEVGRAGAVAFVNDSKATNADSTAKALASWERDIFWILGGKPKEGGITSLADYFPRIAKAYLIGEASDAFAATLQGKVPFERCETLDVATASAARDAADATQSAGLEPVVILSPACASYDQFKSFEHRGNALRNLVATLPGVVMQPRSSP